MAVSKQPLGMNARNHLYVQRYNFREPIRRADDKLATKRTLLRHHIPTPALIATFQHFRDVRKYDWKRAPSSFVIKPAKGYGGEGIAVVRKWDGVSGKWSAGGVVTARELEAHVFGLLDGAASRDHLPDDVLIEERVVVNSRLRKLGAGGVPDVRIIVFRGVPVMAMLRISTEHSHGKANLHQGALGLGVDMRTGITTRGVLFGREVRTIPGTKTKVRGIKVPEWSDVLDTAVRAQEASGLGYAGIDIVFDNKKGPLVLEVNAHPGLQIQVVNGDSLRTRLERVEDMKLPSREYAIDLARRMFAESALRAVEERSNVVGVFDKVILIGTKGKKVVRAKIDTGAYRTSVDRELVEQIGIPFSDTKPEIKVRSGTSDGVVSRQGIDITLRLRGKTIHTIGSVSERQHLRFPVIIGRKDLDGFLVDPGFWVRNLEK
jgi:alpha-L-glutamate ligase-like protein